MEEKGLVERKSDPTHGRKINTLLTSSGKKILGEAHQIVKTIEQEMTAGLSADDVEATIKNLEHCVISLKEE